MMMSRTLHDSSVFTRMDYRIFCRRMRYCYILTDSLFLTKWISLTVHFYASLVHDKVPSLKKFCAIYHRTPLQLVILFPHQCFVFDRGLVPWPAGQDIALLVQHSEICTW